MGGRGDSDRIFLAAGKGLCRDCGKLVPVRYESSDGAVYLTRHCPEHGKASALVAESLRWFQDVHSLVPGSTAPQWTVEKTGECPTSCGPCGMHGQRCHLPVLSITNACDLRCPICFTFNRKDRIWHMPPEEFSRTVDFVIAATGGVDLINITGGEPTLHPELFDLLRLARRPQIGRVTMNTNGLTIARDPDLARRLADEGVYVVLSLDTLDRRTSKALHGADIVDQKRRALDHLERFGVPTTLLMVLVGGVNEAELGDITELSLSADFVRSLTIQTMTYTGQGGGGFLPRQHIPVDGVERRIEEATAGRIARQHFVPLPTAHPLCYGVAYLLRDNRGAIVPLTDLISPDGLAEHLTDGYLLHPSPALEAGFREAIDRLWSSGEAPETLALLKNLLQDLYPAGGALTVAERQRRAERAVKTIYVHAHMDEDTFETGRAMRCPDQVPVDGKRLVSACNYNLFVRKTDERFWVEIMSGDQHFVSTRGLCNECGVLCDANVTFRDGKVYLVKWCPDHGQSEGLISSDRDWYLNSFSYVKPGTEPLSRAVDGHHGCPQSCGLCAEHQQHTCVPILEITGRCNLACPICLTSESDIPELSLAEVESILDRLVQVEGRINTLTLSGGEPTSHPHFREVVTACRRPEIGILSVSTNGIRLAEDEDLLRWLCEQGVVISLQFDGTSPETSRVLRGRPDLPALKLALIDRIGALGGRLSLTVTLARGVNEDELEPVLDLLFTRDEVLCVMVQPLAAAGRAAAGLTAAAADAVTIPEAIERLARASRGVLTAKDFTPLPCSHPTCFALTYLLKAGDGRLVPLPRVLEEESYLEIIKNQALFGTEPEKADRIRDALYSLWSSDGIVPDQERVLGALRQILLDLNRLKDATHRDLLELGTTHVKSIFLHHFMDRATFDLSRVVKCCNHYPQMDGRLIPACVRNNLSPPAPPSA